MGSIIYLAALSNIFTILFKIVIPLSMPVVAVMILFYGVDDDGYSVGYAADQREREVCYGNGIHGAHIADIPVYTEVLCKGSNDRGDKRIKN
ncbi:hypothetical protein [Caldanaerobius polysaccharolyticus]|nr:hypothetical protein [Caldanaerobius polysaccharolyticus]